MSFKEGDICKYKVSVVDGDTQEEKFYKHIYMEIMTELFSRIHSAEDWGIFKK